MKKNIIRIVVMATFYSILGLVSQLFVINIILAVTPVNAQKLDKVLISVNLKNQPLSKVLSEIEQQTEYKFFYLKNEIPINNVTTIRAENEPLNKVLEKLAAQHNLTFKRINKQIAVKKVKIKKDNNIKGRIKGTIIDANSKEPLIGANVIIKGTSLGAAANINGEFILPPLKAGNYLLKVSYVGYKEKTINIKVLSNRTTKVIIKLNWIAVEEDVVLVTAQAKGQLSAINEQLSANEIKNVVSKDRIRELPDANAAESVARLPGVSVVRYGGEGAKVVIRGLSPKYNKVMVDGVQMAATSSGNRSVNMSMISSYSLEGIEVIKAPTANMDANQVGGAVNFKMKTAEKGFNYDIVAQGGYNALRNSYDNYMFVGSVNNRFIDNKLGVFAQLNIEQKNLSSNQMGAGYDLHERTLNKNNKVYTESLSLINSFRKTKRYGGTLTLDYSLPNGQIYLKNFVSSGKTYNNIYSEYFGVSSREHSYTTEDKQNNLLVYNNILSYSQQFEIFKIDAKVSHSYSENETPNNISFSFLIPSDLKNITENDLNNMFPENIPSFAENNINEAFFTDIGDNSELTQGREFMASLDFETDFYISEQINGKIKFGGKALSSKRSYDFEGYGGVMHLGSGTATKNAILNAFPWMQDTTPLGSSYLPYSLFIKKGFEHGDYLNGKYTLGPVADIDLMHKVINVMRKTEESSVETYNYLDMSSKSHDYSGTEFLTAGYLMTDVNITNQIKFIPGIRYEYKKTSYKGVRGISASSFPETKYPHTDTTTIRTNAHFFPMVHLQYKPADWLQFRLAYTKTISRPNFDMIIPRRDIGKLEIEQNNFRLEPELAENFDMYLAISNNYIGLFSIGGFWKNIENMIFYSPKRVILDVKKYDLDPIHSGKFIYSQVNNKDLAIVKGIELDWQTNFWYLPSFLKGIVFNINYTHIFSEAKYPRTEVETEYLLVPPYGVKKTNHDTTYTNRLYNQPDDIVNFAVGYDYLGFSCRLSMLYQSNVFTGPNFWPELRSYTDDYLRWDFSVKQKLPWQGLQVYLNINNITESMDREINAGSQLPTAVEHYGRTIQLGIRWISGK